jgi:hypothetical protein
MSSHHHHGNGNVNVAWMEMRVATAPAYLCLCQPMPMPLPMHSQSYCYAMVQLLQHRVNVILLGFITQSFAFSLTVPKYQLLHRVTHNCRYAKCIIIMLVLIYKYEV